MRQVRVCHKERLIGSLSDARLASVVIICSRNISSSSPVSSTFCTALRRFVSRRARASAYEYSSITLAPNQRHTTPFGEIDAFACTLSARAKKAEKSSPLPAFSSSILTTSSDAEMSGIFARSALRFSTRPFSKSLYFDNIVERASRRFSNDVRLSEMKEPISSCATGDDVRGRPSETNASGSRE